MNISRSSPVVARDLSRRPALQRSLPPRTFFALAVGCAGLILAIYSPSLQFQFILDDHRFTADPRIQEAGHLWDFLTSYVWAQFVGGPPSFYRPMFGLWMRINYMFSMLSPWGWHFLSIAKHVAVATLLGVLIWQLLRDRLAALVFPTLFGLHPAQTESVSWVTVPDPVMTVALLASLILYLVYRDRLYVEPPSKKKRKAAAQTNRAGWLLSSALAYFIALLTKETAMVFPVVIFGVGLCRDARQANSEGGISRGRLSQAVIETLPFAGATLVYLLLRLYALHGSLGSATQHIAWRTVLYSWPGILWFYARTMFWPVKSYSFADPILVGTFSFRSVLLPASAIIGLGGILASGIVWTWRRVEREFDLRKASGTHSALVAGVLLLTLPLLPALNLNALNPGDFLHGRYTYLPLAGLMILVASGFCLAGKWKLPIAAAVAVLVFAFAVLTVRQEVQWKDDSTVFTVAHELAPHNAPVARNLTNTRVRAALIWSDDGQCSDAMPVFQQAIRDYPDDWYAWIGQGDCLVQRNDLTKAEESLHRAADLSHDSRVVEHWQQLRAHMGLSPGVEP